MERQKINWTEAIAAWTVVLVMLFALLFSASRDCAKNLVPRASCEDIGPGLYNFFAGKP